MDKITLIIGGCRSGKSSQAVVLAENLPGPRIFLATCLPMDDEMRARVAKHQAERSQDWETVEVPYLLAQAIHENSRKAGVLLVDCLTLWISNLMLKNLQPDDVIQACPALIQALHEAACPVLLVSNEVGCGIVPENGLARQFRDLVGMVNQKLATLAQKVVWMTAGIPVIIKSGRSGQRE